jgi:hypothetical protein
MQTFAQPAELDDKPITMAELMAMEQAEEELKAAL